MKKQQLSEVYKTGDKVTVQMQKPSKGNFPIGRTEKGVICKIQTDKKSFFDYNSTWLCEILEIHEKKLVIKPIDCLITAKEESKIFGEKINQLSNISGEKKRRERKTVNYEYHSKNG